MKTAPQNPEFSNTDTAIKRVYCVDRLNRLPKGEIQSLLMFSQAERPHRAGTRLNGKTIHKPAAEL